MGNTQPQGEPMGVAVSGSIQIWSQAVKKPINKYMSG